MKNKESVLVISLFFIINCFFFQKTFFGSVPFPGDLLMAQYQPWRSYQNYPTKNQYFDVIRQIYPWKTESINQIRQGQIPFWNPYNFSGTPLLANFQSAIFYPLNFFYLILPQISAWSLLIFLQPLLAAFFTYLFCRNLGLKKISSVFSGLAYGFSLFMSTFLEYNTIGHAILWLPLILLSIDKLIIKNNIKWVAIFLFSLYSSFLAGHLQISIYVILFSLLYLLFRIFNSALMIYIIKAKLILFGSLYGIAIVLTMPQWLLTFQLIEKSARVSQNYNFLINQFLIQPKDLLRFFSPDIFGNPAVGNYLLNDPYPGKAVYIGLLPIIFAFLSLWQFKKNQFVKFFSLSFVTIFLFLFRWPLAEWFYKIQIPLFSTSSPSNIVFLLSFCLAILAGFGVENWQKTPKKIIIPYVLILSLFLIFWPGLILVKKNLYYSIILGSEAGLLLLIKRFHPRISNLIIVGLIGLTIFDLYYFFNKFNPFVPIQLVYPETPVLSWLKKNAGINRIWGYGTANFEANFGTQEKIYTIEGYDPLYIKRYGEFIRAGKDGKLKETFNNQNRSDAILVNGFGTKLFDSNSYRKRILNLLGVKYLLNKVENGDSSKIFPVEKYKLVYQDDYGWQIFENLEVLPRVFLASDYKIFKIKEEFQKLFFAKTFNPLKTIMLEEKPVCIYSNDLNHWSGLVTIESYKENEIKINVQVKNCSFLFLSDTYYLGWKAYVDGKETKIYRADYAFRAVEVPAGAHEVIFRYQPLMLK